MGGVHAGLPFIYCGYGWPSAAELWDDKNQRPTMLGRELWILLISGYRLKGALLGPDKEWQKKNNGNPKEEDRCQESPFRLAQGYSELDMAQLTFYRSDVELANSLTLKKIFNLRPFKNKVNFFDYLCTFGPRKIIQYIAQPQGK